MELRKTSQSLYYMFLMCTSYFRFWSESICWGFHIATHGLCHLLIWGHLFSITPSTPLNGIEWLSQNPYCMCPLCTSHFRFWSESIWGFHNSKTWTLSFLNMGMWKDPSRIGYSFYIMEGNFHRIFNTCSFCAPLILYFDLNQCGGFT